MVKMDGFVSYEQQQVFLGTMLGDGCLFKSKKNTNYRMNLAHSLKQQKYFLMKYEHLKGIVDNGYKITGQYDKRTNKRYEYIKLQTKTSEFLTSWRKRLYNKEGKRFVSKEVANQLDAMAIAMFYFDDGWRENHDDAMNITVVDFDKDSIYNLANRIEKVFNIKVSVKLTSSWRIRIPVKYAKKFSDGIRQYATSDVLYKLI